MTGCYFCDVLKRKTNSKVIYEDDACIGFLTEYAHTPGHIIVVPKEHYPIIENCPEEIYAKMFNAANKLSIMAFEVLKAKGTNTLIQNGVSAGQDTAHCAIHIIPRNDKDNLDFEWETHEASKEELSDAELMLKEETKNIVEGKVAEKPKPREIDSGGEEIKSNEGEKDYMIEQLRRMP